MTGRDRVERFLRYALVVVPALGLAAGTVAHVSGLTDLAAVIWGAAVIPVILALGVDIAVGLGRAEIGLDIVAFLSMAGALMLGETLAGAVVALMYAGGQFLESYATGRARHEMAALLERAPKTAMRYDGETLADVPITEVEIGDRLLVRAGEIVPADGIVVGGTAVLDQSALTGEPLPSVYPPGQPVMSGSANAGPSFDLTVTRPAAASTYAGIVRLVEAASRVKAPMVRLADRYSLVFLAVTLTIAAAAWIASDDPVRWLAVMVVATPCPLILAVPVAIVAGVSRAAKSGLLVKGGGALETLARVRVLVIDKTGTLTEGRPTLTAIHANGAVPADELLRLAASLDQASGHIVARALIAAAAARRLPLSPPSQVRETHGSGVRGRVDGHEVALGGFEFVRDHAHGNPTEISTEGAGDGEMAVTVAVDGAMAGQLVLSDRIRPNVPATLDRLRQLGIGRIILASGDQAAAANAVGRRLGIDTVNSALTPEAKVAAVLAERVHGPVMMVGDGVNDAPALAAADIGIAMGGSGNLASAEAADAVLLVDELDRLATAMAIARRARRIATQSVLAGIGLSFAAMLFAAFGYLPPVQGALVQEVIDVAVILNALRVLRGTSDGAR